jgi:hypothetical protein
MGVIGGDNAGFPNGRRLADDVIDIALQVMEGAATNGPVQALAAGDGVNGNDVAFGDTFPYVALPHATAVNQTPHMTALPPAGGDGGGFGGHRIPIAAASLAAALVAMAMAVLARRRRSFTV